MIQGEGSAHISGVTPQEVFDFVLDTEHYRKADTKAPSFPKRFTGIDHARAFCTWFFEHYNHQHRHSGIGLHTPADVHYGRATEIRARRQTVLDAAYTARPERFRRPPSAPRVPEATWINPPEETPLATATI